MCPMNEKSDHLLSYRVSSKQNSPYHLQQHPEIEFKLGTNDEEDQELPCSRHVLEEFKKSILTSFRQEAL